MSDTTITREGSLRELATDKGVLRYYEAGDGPPLILLHGSGPGVTGWRNFNGNFARFAEHFHTYILELPGFGISDTTDEHPMGGASNAVIRFMDGLGLAKASFVGNSMGGLVAATVAIRNPERVDKLVTIGGIGKNVFGPYLSEGIKLLREFTDNPSREALIRWLHAMVWNKDVVTEELIEQRWTAAIEPSTLESARKMYGTGALEAGAKAAAEAGIAPLWTQLGKIRAKTLLTWGRDDRVSPVEMSLIPMRDIPDVQVSIFPNCGHWVMIEQKAAWEATVLAFLTTPEPDRDVA